MPENAAERALLVMSPPFAGPTTVMLDRWLGAAGLDSYRLFQFTYADSLPALARDLKERPPQVVVGLGASVRAACSKLTKFSHQVSAVPGRIPTFYTYHPVACLNSAKFSNLWYEDASTLNRWLEENPW